MSITKEAELTGMKKASEAVAQTLKEMRTYARLPSGITASFLFFEEIFHDILP